MAQGSEADGNQAAMHRKETHVIFHMRLLQLERLQPRFQPALVDNNLVPSPSYPLLTPAVGFQPLLRLVGFAATTGRHFMLNNTLYRPLLLVLVIHAAN